MDRIVLMLVAFVVFAFFASTLRAIWVYGVNADTLAYAGLGCALSIAVVIFATKN